MGLPREKTRATKFAVVKVCICVIILRKLHTGKLMLELDEFYFTVLGVFCLEFEMDFV